MQDTQQVDPELLVLQQTGWWREVALHLEPGDRIVIVANCTGSPPKANETMLRKATLHAASFRDIPYLLIGDANTDPGASVAIRTALANEQVYDVAKDHGLEGPTFSQAKGGVREGMVGNGTSRIDVVLANAAGAERVRGVWYDWHLSSTSDHVAVVVAIERGSYKQAGHRLAMPPRFDIGALENRTGP